MKEEFNSQKALVELLGVPFLTSNGQLLATYWTIGKALPKVNGSLPHILNIPRNTQSKNLSGDSNRPVYMAVGEVINDFYSGHAEELILKGTKVFAYYRNLWAAPASVFVQVDEKHVDTLYGNGLYTGLESILIRRWLKNHYNLEVRAK